MLKSAVVTSERYDILFVNENYKITNTMTLTMTEKLNECQAETVQFMSIEKVYI